jgi:glucose/mannose transport system permease protein
MRSGSSGSAGRRPAMADSALAATIDDPAASLAARRYFWGRVGIYAFLSFFAFIYILPLFVIVANSFRELPEIFQNGLIGFPHSFSLKAWGTVWSSYCVGGTCAGIEHNFFNSLEMAVPATIISTLLGLVNGYILTKWRFPGSEIIFTGMMFGVFMPGQVSLMPWAFILGHVGLSNSIFGLILIHCVQGISFTTLFCRNYYINIPDDLIKAARIDGAGFWRIFFKIILPLSPPILIVTVIWQFTGIWNEYLFGVVFTAGRNQPITASLIGMATGGTSVRVYDVMSAGVLIGAIPPLLIYFFGGKYFVRGLTQGAIK